MQSSELSNPSATSFSRVSDNMEVIAQEIGSRKRKHSEITGNVDDRKEISKESKGECFTKKKQFTRLTEFILKF